MDTTSNSNSPENCNKINNKENNSMNHKNASSEDNDDLMKSSISHKHTTTSNNQKKRNNNNNHKKKSRNNNNNNNHSNNDNRNKDNDNDNDNDDNSDNNNDNNNKANRNFDDNNKSKVDKKNNNKNNKGNNNNGNKTTNIATTIQQQDDELPACALRSGIDPRQRSGGGDDDGRITKKATKRGKGRNTESFDPISTLVRPDLRIHVGSNQIRTYNKPLKHDDVVIIPELFGPEDNWNIYYQLVQELTSATNDNSKDGVEWVSWHEGAHLITKQPETSHTYLKIIHRLCEYFKMEQTNIGTRLNWYTDSADWKPFHHDSAAFNPQRAKHQNITVGASFGATRELAFIRAAALVDHDEEGKNNPQESDDKVRLYFPQTNNSVFSFGRDANIRWKHGINALHPEEQDGKGRISIIVWGLAQDVIEEDESPPMLGVEHGHGGGRGRGGRGGRARGGRGRHGRGGGGRGSRGRAGGQG